MTRWLTALLLCGTLSIGYAAQAQVRPSVPRTTPSSRPSTVSPYLNMLRGGNPAFNYFSLVKPQIAAQETLKDLEQRQQEMQQETQQLSDQMQTGTPQTRSRGFTTGHPTHFFYYGPYFPNKK